MNVNLLTIDVLSETPAEPTRSVSARLASAADGNNGNSQIKGVAVDKRLRQPLATSVPQQNVTQKSYNVASGTRIEGKRPSNDRFENVFKRQLKSDKSLNEEGERKIVKKSQNSGSNNKTEQVQSVAGLPVSQMAAISLGEQKRISTDKTTLNRPNQSASKLPTPTSQNSSNSTLVAGKSGQIDKKDNLARGNELQQTRLASGAAKNATNAGQPTLMTTTQASVVKQGQGHSANMQQISPDAVADKTNGNNIKLRAVNDTVKTNVPANKSQAESGKSAALGNQSNIDKAEQSIGLTNQPGLILSKVPFAALQTQASFGNNDIGLVMKSSTAGGQRTGTETSNRDRVKDSTAGSRQGDSRQLSVNSRTAMSVEKLNVEKVELLSDKNGTQKSDSGNTATQSVRGHTMSFGVNDAVLGNRPIIVDNGASSTANNSQTDTAAAIREQIYLAVQGSIKQGQQQITIHLNPPELGRVSIKFSEQNHELTGLLETSSSQTRAEIRQALPDIIRSLEESGISVKRLDVTLSDSSAKSDLMRQSTQQSLRDNSSQDLWDQFGNHSNQDNGGNLPSYDSFVSPALLDKTLEFHSETLLGPHQTSSSDKLLDVLI
jgi:flagellar hook-length control protein FliK